MSRRPQRLLGARMGGLGLADPFERRFVGLTCGPLGGLRHLDPAPGLVELGIDPVGARPDRLAERLELLLLVGQRLGVLRRELGRILGGDPRLVEPNLGVAEAITTGDLLAQGALQGLALRTEVPHGRVETVEFRRGERRPVPAGGRAQVLLLGGDRGDRLSRSRSAAAADSDAVRNAPAHSVTLRSAASTDPVRGNDFAASSSAVIRSPISRSCSRSDSTSARHSAMVVSSSTMRRCRRRARAVAPMNSACSLTWRPSCTP
ncbi:hypothetical protein NJ76_20060 [Rhodococcus sp. IITR03]|nr:hypothetical protein NJ76_20060 [Rhodococcus sp. IITR03]